MRTIRVATFEGPLDLLLELIEGAKLDISEVALATVTEQYLEALASAEGLPTDELADFLVVAARLLLLKSRLLLPGIVGPEDEAVGLAQQLTLYRKFVEASRVLRGQLGSHRTLFPREHPLAAGPLFLPPKTVSALTLAVTFRGFLDKLEPPVYVTPELVRRTVSLQERIRDIHALLAAREQLGFTELLATATNRTEVIVTFLALLELVKQRTVSVAQGALFEEITVQTYGNGTPA